MHYFLILIAFITFSGNAQHSLRDVLDKYNDESIPYIHVSELAKLDKSKVILVDAREKDEFNISHLKNAFYSGYNDFDPEFLKQNKISKDRKIIVYCSLGVRSEDIAKKIRKLGYTEVYNLYGGIFEWKNKGFPVFDTEGKTTEKVHAFSKEWGIYLKKGQKVYE